MTLRSCLAFVAVLFMVCPTLNGELVDFNLRDSAGSAGEALEDFGTFTQSGITLTVSGIPAPFAATGNGSGVGTNSALTDGEQLTITVTFAVPTVTLNFIDLRAVANTAADAAFINIGGITNTLFGGQPDFNPSTDVWTPSGGIVLSSGDSIIFRAADRYRIQAIQFEMMTVPETNAAVAFLSAIVMSIFIRRKRR